MEVAEIRCQPRFCACDPKDKLCLKNCILESQCLSQRECVRPYCAELSLLTLQLLQAAPTPEGIEPDTNFLVPKS